MTSKMKLLASVAIAAVSLVGAQGASAGNYYVNVSGGANWLHDDSFDNVSLPNTFAFDNNTQVGFTLSAAAGMHLDNVLPGLRVEGEFAYRENDVRGFWSTDIVGNFNSTSGPLDYQASTYSILANAWYDFSVLGLNPYVGGGIGWAHSNLEGLFVNGSPDALSESDGGFAWQLGAGLTFDIQPGTKLNIGYRYFQGPDVTVNSPRSTNPLTGDVSDKNDTVTVGFTFGL